MCPFPMLLNDIDSKDQGKGFVGEAGIKWNPENQNKIHIVLTYPSLYPRKKRHLYFFQLEM